MVLALENVLNESEKRNGFGSVIKLENKEYDRSEWLSMLRGGSLFKDTIFADPRADARTRHGQETHRIQWWAIMRDSKNHPEIYLKPVSYYFRLIGDPRIDMEQQRSFWFQLVDQFRDESNYSSPEFLHIHHFLWPGLGLWF